MVGHKHKGIPSLEVCTIDSGQVLYDFLSGQPDGYLKYFTPFHIDAQYLHSMVLQNVDDIYYGVWLDDRMVAFFMLRTLGGRYTTPSFGVVVDHEFSGFGIARMCFEYAIHHCRIVAVDEILVHVYKENAPALSLFNSYMAARVEDLGDMYAFWFSVDTTARLPSFASAVSLQKDAAELVKLIEQNWGFTPTQDFCKSFLSFIYGVGGQHERGE